MYGCGILHTKRFKKEIDLALLGIEKWADDRAYFCTPRKAGIIGRDGVPGALCRHELYRYAGTAGRRYDPSYVAGIGFIGGADGPASAFVGEEQGKLRMACSLLRFGGECGIADDFPRKAV